MIQQISLSVLDEATGKKSVASSLTVFLKKKAVGTHYLLLKHIAYKITVLILFAPIGLVLACIMGILGMIDYNHIKQLEQAE